MLPEPPSGGQEAEDHWAPMTDLDRLKALFDSWGVTYELDADDEGAALTVRPAWWSDPDASKRGGYAGFFTRYEFASDGSFFTMGAWE